MTTLNEYQDKALATAIYPGRGSMLGLAYVGLGLGESGEVQGKIKKILRDNKGEITPAIRFQIAQELGDLLWYVAATAAELSVPLDSVAQWNLEKLADRADRGTLQGSGDTR